MPTKTIGRYCDGPGGAHSPINLNFIKSFAKREKAKNIHGYIGGGGGTSNLVTTAGEINYYPATPTFTSEHISIPNDDKFVMKFCQTLTKPTLSHYMFTAIFGNLSKVILRNNTTIKRSNKNINISCFETKRFLFLEQNQNKDSQYGRRAKNGSRIMWVIRKEDNTYIGRVENGTLYKT